MAGHAIFIVHRARPGQRDAVRDIWMKHMAPAIAGNEGHLTYHYCFDTNDADLIRVFQLYRDAEDAAAFLKHPNYAAYQDEVRELLIEPSEVHAAEPQWQRQALDVHVNVKHRRNIFGGLELA